MGPPGFDSSPGFLVPAKFPKNPTIGVNQQGSVAHQIQIYGALAEVLNEHPQVLIPTQVFLLLQIIKLEYSQQIWLSAILKLKFTFQMEKRLWHFTPECRWVGLWVILSDSH